MPTKIFCLQQSKPKHFVFSLLAIFFLTPGYAQKKINHVKSSFTATLMNLEETAKQPFRYNTSLHNGSVDAQTYELEAFVPEGWITTFEVEGSEVGSIRIDSGRTQNVSIEITASPVVKPGKYAILATAVSARDTLKLELEAVVKGTYDVGLTTPTGLLSADVTEGTSKVLQLTVENNGTLPLDGLQLSAQAPLNWTATFDPSKIQRLDPGKTQDVNVTLNVPDKTIAGDYVTTFTVKNNYANADTTFRMTVTTSLLSGWLGILVILLALGIVYYLIRKYGRR
ncbi:MAG TPA: NEW3 domain-containing protein [Hanamia sp.]|nr:NEW3 domain-containing protein [Hanamia sp.]